MATSVATLIDAAKAMADKRSDASVPDADWLRYVNYSVEDLYRLLVSIDPAVYFSSADVALAGGLTSMATIDLTSLAGTAFLVRGTITTALPAFTGPSGAGPGSFITAVANGVFPTIDGTITPVVGDRVFVTPAAGTATTCGVYVFTAVGAVGAKWILTRSTDYDQSSVSEIHIGAMIRATEGLTNIGVTYTLTGYNSAQGPDNSTQVYTIFPVPVFRSLHGLDLNPDTVLRRTVPRRNFRERNMGRVGWWSPTLFAIDRAYDLRGTSLVVTPYEFASGNYRVYYRSGPYNFNAPTDVTPLDAILDPYNEWVVLKAARKGLKVEESDSAPWTEEIESLRESIISSHMRDDVEPSIIADVEGDSGGTWGWP